MGIDVQVSHTAEAGVRCIGAGVAGCWEPTGSSMRPESALHRRAVSLVHECLLEKINFVTRTNSHI